MRKLLILAILIGGCVVNDPAPLDDAAMVETAAALWADTYGWTEACEAELPAVHVIWVERGECPHADIARACEDGPTLKIVQRGMLQSEHAELVAHEFAHWALKCSGRALGGDPEHTARDVWQGWVPATARQLAP